jgi:hypothetical protein
VRLGGYFRQCAGFCIDQNPPSKCRIASRDKSFYLGCVKYSGKASLAALCLIGLSGAGIVALIAVAFLA